MGSMLKERARFITARKSVWPGRDGAKGGRGVSRVLKERERGARLQKRTQNYACFSEVSRDLRDTLDTFWDAEDAIWDVEDSKGDAGDKKSDTRTERTGGGVRRRRAS